MFYNQIYRGDSNTAAFHEISHTEYGYSHSSTLQEAFELVTRYLLSQLLNASAHAMYYAALFWLNPSAPDSGAPLAHFIPPSTPLLLHGQFPSVSISFKIRVQHSHFTVRPHPFDIALISTKHFSHYRVEQIFDFSNHLDDSAHCCAFLVYKPNVRAPATLVC